MGIGNSGICLFFSWDFIKYHQLSSFLLTYTQVGRLFFSFFIDSTQDMCRNRCMYTRVRCIFFVTKPKNLVPLFQTRINLNLTSRLYPFVLNI